MDWQPPICSFCIELHRQFPSPPFHLEAEIVLGAVSRKGGGTPKRGHLGFAKVLNCQRFANCVFFCVFFSEPLTNLTEIAKDKKTKGTKNQGKEGLDNACLSACCAQAVIDSESILDWVAEAAPAVSGENADQGRAWRDSSSVLGTTVDGPYPPLLINSESFEVGFFGPLV